MVGFNEAHSMRSGFSHLLTGSPSDKSQWILISGAIATLAGVISLLFNSKLGVHEFSFNLSARCGTIPSAQSMKLFDLSGEVAVVIGATGVLGGAIAEGLAQAGAKVAILGRNAERGDARVKLIHAQGGHAHFFAADAMSRDSLRLRASGNSKNPRRSLHPRQRRRW